MLNFYLSLIEKEENKNKLAIIYDTYKYAMYHAAFGILGDKEEAEDAVHEAFLYYSENESKMPDINHKYCKSYVCQEAIEQARRIYKKKKRRPDIVDIDDEQIEECIEDFDICILDTVISEEAYDLMIQALEKLPEKYFNVLYMHYVEELTVKEISNKTKIKRKTVEKQLNRGRVLWGEKIKEKKSHD